MKATVEPLEGNKVKVSIEVDETEFDKNVDAAFKRIAREVRLPGFRPGKAPRRLLEARLGREYGREQALREAIPLYYTQAVIEHDVDVIAQPSFEVTGGQDDGPVAFEAVVEIRPKVDVAGYGGLRVAVPRPAASDDEIDAQIDRLREQFAELAEADRPAIDGDHVTISINCTRDGKPVPGMQADDYLYEVGTGTITPEVDENLRGTKSGDVVSFDAQPADETQGPVTFRLLVKDVQRKVLPEPDDEWANEVSEFETLADLRASLGANIADMHRRQARSLLRQRAALALTDLVEDEPPEALVSAELNEQIRALVARLGQQGVSAEDYLEATGQSADQLVESRREVAAQAVKVDLALRALADAEAIDCSDDDYEDYLVRLAAAAERDVAGVRGELERADGVTAVRSDIRKRKALEWLVEHVEVVDEEGQPIDREALVVVEADEDDDLDDVDDEFDDDAEQEDES